MTTTPEDLAAFPNRYAVEREIEAAENPAPGTMHLNDGHERVRLPGGTLRRMLAAIDRLAAMASSAQQGEPVAPRLDVLIEMAYLLRIVPRGDTVPVQILDTLRRQYAAALQANDTKKGQP